MQRSRIETILAGGALLVAGYLAGAGHAPTVAADGDARADVTPLATPGVMGVPIPNGGGALVKGRDGFAYIVDSRGLYVRASQSGKGLELP